MGRKNKFRVWDELNKFYDGCYLPGFDGSILEFDKDGTYREVKNDNKIVEQFTGLIDKNGVEIYEGDIIEYYREKKVVFFSSNFASFKFKDFNKCSLFSDGDINKYRCEQIKVVGNIHEK